MVSVEGLSLRYYIGLVLYSVIVGVGVGVVVVVVVVVVFGCRLENWL